MSAALLGSGRVSTDRRDVVINKDLNIAVNRPIDPFEALRSLCMSPNPPHLPAWTSSTVVVIGVIAAVAISAVVGSAVPLVALTIPAAILGYRAGWRAGTPPTPAALPEASELSAESIVAPSSVPEPSPEPLAEGARQWVDEVAVLERMGGSIEILMELTDLFANENVRRLAALRAAISAGDPLQVSREAHGIKSGLTNFCAEEAVALAFQIEDSAKKGSLDGLETATDVLEAVLNSVTEQLTMMGKAA